MKAPLARWIAAVGLLALIGIGMLVLRKPRAAAPPGAQISTGQLRSLAAAHPTPSVYLQLFKRLHDESKTDEALKTARAMVRRYPGDARGHNILGIAYGDVGDSAGARAAFNNAIKLSPKYVDPYVNLGRLSLFIGDNQRAVNEFDLATTVDPKSASAWTGLGEAHAKLYNTAEAPDAFQRAIKLAPNRPQAYAHLGVFLAEMGNGDKARPYLKRAQELGDQSPALFTGLAMAYADGPQSREELTQALNYAARAEQLGDHGSLLHYARGLALQRLGRYTEAITDFKYVLSISDNANGAWIGISQCYRALGNKKLADDAAKTGERVLAQRLHISNLKHQIALAPSRFDLREQYADSLFTNGQYLMAADQYRYVAIHNPEKPSVWLKSAHAFEMGGEKDLANYVRQFAYEKAEPPKSAQSTPSVLPGPPE
jgi:Flp pilus assembly protein TadD